MNKDHNVLLVFICIFLCGIMFMIHDVAVALREILEVLQ